MEPYLAEEQGAREYLLPSQHKNSRNLKDESTQEISLSEDTGFTFKAGKRPYRDSVFTFLFLGAILLTYGFGIFAYTRADFNLDSKLRHSKFNPDTNQCEVLEEGFHEDVHAYSMWLKLMIFLPICALLVTFPVGTFLFWLLRRYTRGVVLVANLLITLVPIGLCIFWFTWCYGINGFCAQVLDVGVQVIYAVFYSALTALSVYRLCKTWSGNTFEASAQLLKMATDALKQHVLLLFLQPALFLGSLVLVNGPIFAFMWCALYNGKIVPNFDVVHAQATGYPSCVERHPEWFTAYIRFACFTAFWVLMSTLQLQVMVVSGIISQWYFAPAGSSTSGNIKRSLRIAFGSSFGTACNLGTLVTSLVVALLGLLKKVTNRVANSSRQGMISVITRGCLSWMFQFPEGYSLFAPHFAIISGRSFWESSKMAVSLLRRNSLNTTGKNFSIPTQRVLMGMTFTYSLFQSLAVYGVLEYFLNSEPWNIFIAANCFTAALLGLIQVSLSVSSVIETVYICYAMEKDTGVISKPEICHAYMLLENEAALAGAVAPEDKLSAP